MMRPDRDTWAMSLAVLTAQRTTCLKQPVGCVLLNERGHVVGTGYNGVAAGMPHCNEVTHMRFKTLEKPRRLEPVYGNACAGHDLPPGQDRCEAVHAEQNALLQCRDVYEVHTAYVTLLPCLACAKILLNTGCQRIVYLKPWVKTDSIDLWRKAGREIVQFEFANDYLQNLGNLIE